jgi:hypothetical protein
MLDIEAVVRDKEYTVAKLKIKNPNSAKMCIN